MSDLGELQVSVTADISDLQTKIAQAGGVTKDFGTTAAAGALKAQTAFKSLGESATGTIGILKQALVGLKANLLNASGDSIAFFNKEIQDTERELKELQSVGLESTSKLGGALERLTDPSSLAATAVSRVRREIVGLGLSVVGGELLAPLIQELGKYIESLFAATQATNKFSLSSKELQKDFNSINQSSGTDQAKVLELVTALNSQTLSISQTKAALKDLQSISPEYFGSLTSAKGKVNDLTEAYNKYTKAVLPSLSNKVDDKSLSAIQEQLNTINIEGDLNSATKASAQQQLNDLVAKGGAQYAGILKTQVSIISQDVQQNNLLTQQDDILKRMTSRNFDGLIKPEKIKNGVKSVADILAELQRQLDFLNTKQLTLKTDEAKEEIGAIQSTINKLIDTKGFKQDNPIILNLLAKIAIADIKENAIKLADDAVKEIQKIKGFDGTAIEQAIQVRVKAFELLDPIKSPQELLKAAFELNRYIDLVIPVTITPKIDGKSSEQIFKDAFEKETNKLNIPEGTSVFPQLDLSSGIKGLDTYVGDTKQILELQNKLKSEFVSFSKFDTYAELTKKDNAYKVSFANLVNALSQDIQTTLDKTFEGLGSSIGKALATGGNVASAAFESLFQTIGAGLKQMGDALIIYGVGIQALKTAAINPVLAIAAGVALEIAGSALESYVPKFASGVQNFGGGIALVGERGPELVNLPRGSDVIPNHALGGIGGTTQSLKVYGETLTRGRDIVTIYNRGVISNNQNYGR